MDPVGLLPKLAQVKGMAWKCTLGRGRAQVPACVSSVGCGRGRKQSLLTRDTKGQLGGAKVHLFSIGESKGEPGWERKSLRWVWGSSQAWQEGMNLQGSFLFLGCFYFSSHLQCKQGQLVLHAELWKMSINGTESSAGGFFFFQSPARSRAEVKPPGAAGWEPS